MFTLKIEHPIRDFDLWRAAFERDPVGRQQNGVRAYRVFRPTDDPRAVIIDLDFERPGEAETFLALLQEKVWSRPESSPALVRPGDGGPAVSPPRIRIVETVEQKTY